MIHFTHPLFLWALAGLSIPIGVHLLSRKEGKVLRLGSLRHVEETSTQQFKGIRLNEILLLILRCLILALLCLLMSGMKIKYSGEKKWVLIEKGLETDSRVLPILDSLKDSGYEAHYLDQHFPILGDSIPAGPSINYRMIVRQLTEMNLTEAVVFAYNRADGFTGLRAPLPPTIQWIEIPMDNHDYLLSTIALPDGQVSLRTGHSGATMTNFTTEVTARNIAGVNPPDTISILISGDEKYAYSKRILKAAIAAIQESFPVVIRMTTKNTEKAHFNWCIWISDKEIPKGVAEKYLVLKVQTSQDLIVKENYHQWDITQLLNEELALKSNLTLQVAQLLLPVTAQWRVAAQNDRRMLPEPIAWSAPGKGSQFGVISMASAETYLSAMLLILLLIERSVAYQRNQ